LENKSGNVLEATKIHKLWEIGSLQKRGALNEAHTFEGRRKGKNVFSQEKKKTEYH